MRRFLNPLVLNLQKMELELTCPVWCVRHLAASCSLLSSLHSALLLSLVVCRASNSSSVYR
jgi:hypothetical protein